jgi:multidrug transporter EmrE-like cation transporter
VSAWLWLAGGVVAQVLGVTALRASDGMRRRGPAAGTFLGIGVSVVLVARALADGLSLAVGYGVWTGAGIVGAALVGAAGFGDRLGRTQLVGLGLVLVGAVVLQLGSA